MNPDSPTQRYDAVVIGGGPAGSTTATFLARSGKNVLVLEKETFPRFHIGESLLPYNVPLFAEMGVLPEMEAAGFMEKFGAQFHMPDGSVGAEIRFGGGKYTHQPQSWQVERSTFDDILLRHAEKSGARIREGTAVKSYQITEGSGVSLITSHGDTVEAEFLVDASGMSNFTGNREGIKESFAQHQKVAIFGHFSGIKLPEGKAAGDIIIYRLENGWFWFIPLSLEKVSVGLVVDRTRMNTHEGTPAELFQQAVEASPELAKHMATAKLIDKIRTASDFSYRNQRFVSPHLIRVGDAAGFLDPVFSSGVYLAMLGGKNAAAAVSEAINLGQPFTRGMRRYQKQTRDFMKAYFDLIENFYTRSFMELLFRPEASHFNLSDAVIAILAGQLEGGTAVNWRIKLFLLLARIQSRFPLVPRLDWKTSA